MVETGQHGIEIRGLSKIFGTHGPSLVPLLEQGISKSELNERHGHVLGLKDINISMPSGDIQVIMGLSGSGKSTLIRHINRLIEPSAGEILVGGQDVVKMPLHDLRQFRRHKTAMVFQKFALLPHRNVMENIVYGLEIQGVTYQRQLASAMYWLERVGLKNFETKYPNQLSGGMQQRVGLARALANDAPILLMDEAFSALDPLIRVDMQSILLELQKEIKKTIVFITHDLDEALRLGDRIAILRDGEVIQQGTGQEIVLRPVDEYIAKFVREVNRGAVLSVSAAMQALTEPVETVGARIAADATLEGALRTLNDQNVQRALVVDAMGKPIGLLTMQAVISAIVNPSPRHTGDGSTDALNSEYDVVQKKSHF
ncbi:glycine betaine/L-proline ABC transporter ATP-binding protein [Agrobacterium tumefaciens]|uniref:quaternary amine ABC transporter ATP-binding protein n=1 Tax=Agrobacterium tumefaciens TaxID=358 RepID=UPI001571AFD0|nr:glycine betaine/L-proline ABC transporter ATP-binding protein [Agrobacterium tumefaciens]NTE68175.1 glycine betaine/L-proline ABC transporter ATP-binding protein [Agrobacterium tumefaciens]